MPDSEGVESIDERAGRVVHQQDPQWKAIPWEHLHPSTRTRYIDTARLVRGVPLTEATDEPA